MDLGEEMKLRELLLNQDEYVLNINNFFNMFCKYYLKRN